MTEFARVGDVEHAGPSEAERGPLEAERITCGPRHRLVLLDNGMLVSYERILKRWSEPIDDLRRETRNFIHDDVATGADVH